MIYLDINGYDFLGEICVDRKIINIEGFYSVYWDGDQPIIELDCLYDRDADKPLILSSNSIQHIKDEILNHGDPLEWAQDREDAKADYYYELYRESKSE